MKQFLVQFKVLPYVFVVIEAHGIFFRGKSLLTVLVPGCQSFFHGFCHVFRLERVEVACVILANLRQAGESRREDLAIIAHCLKNGEAKSLQSAWKQESLAIGLHLIRWCRIKKKKKILQKLKNRNRKRDKNP